MAPPFYGTSAGFRHGDAQVWLFACISCCVVRMCMCVCVHVVGLFSVSNRTLCIMAPPFYGTSICWYVVRMTLDTIYIRIIYNTTYQHIHANSHIYI